jgi:hypothetical protein
MVKTHSDALGNGQISSFSVDGRRLRKTKLHVPFWLDPQVSGAREV